VLASRHPDVHAVLLGQGPEEAALCALAAAPRAQGRIHVVGPQRSDDLLATVAGLDLYAYASLRESLPLAVLEAMHLGRPIVSTAVGDLPSVLGNGDAGVLVPPGDVAALAAAIDALRADAPRRVVLAARALAIARTRFSAERLGLEVTDALLEVAGVAR
jgi:glycosyltransferase involved in cell wall biosynthesis